MLKRRKFVAEKAAELLREIKQTNPSTDLEKITKKLRINVQYVEPPEEDISGFLLVEPNGATIGIKENDCPKRRRDRSFCTGASFRPFHAAHRAEVNYSLSKLSILRRSER